jgi:soluble lytic murein transglycosylase
MRSAPGTRLAAIVLLLLFGACACADTSVGLRREFTDAYRIAGAGTRAVTPDSRELNEYVLYPYLEAARLRRDLTSNGAIAAFLERHRGEPVAEGLRRDWLAALGARRDWQTYLANYEPVDDDGATLRCYAIAARIALARDDKNLERDALEQWLVGDSAPDACDPAFAWLKSRGLLTPGRIEQRARLALAAGHTALARFLARDLSAAQAEPLTLWADLIDRPGPTIDRVIASPGLKVEPEALLDGWSRLARRDPAAAVSRFEPLVSSRGLDAVGASPYAVALGTGLALNRAAGALDFFALARPDDFDERAHEWHARAALWAGDWARVKTAIAAMPPALAGQNRWRYWLARAAEKSDDLDKARELYALVLPTDNWYAVLAAARLGRQFEPSLQPIEFDSREVAQLAGLPGMVRARELYACGLENEATVEWQEAYATLTPSQQRAAIRLAADWNWHLQSIATAARQSQFNDYPLLYPRPYDSIVRSAARMTNLPDASIYAVIRQESLYRADAGSSAGALGLMQLLPSTAKRAARRWDLKPPSPGDLLEPAVNVPIGAGELRNLIDHFDGQELAAYAAYNAGPGAARRWLPSTPVDADVWVENIPFNETRAYVQRVAWHRVVFDWLQARKPVDTSSWLTRINPVTAVAQLDD